MNEKMLIDEKLILSDFAGQIKYTASCAASEIRGFGGIDRMFSLGIDFAICETEGAVEKTCAEPPMQAAEGGLTRDGTYACVFWFPFRYRSEEEEANL